MKRLIITGVAFSVLLTLGGVAHAQTGGSPITVPFSDPSRPGTLKVNLFGGSIAVRVGSGRDVVVTTQARRDPDALKELEKDRDRERERNRDRGRPADDPSAAGLRRLTQPAGLTVTEDDNIVSVSAPAPFGNVNVVVLVPASTSVMLRTINGGEVSVEGLTGSIDVNNVNGSIRLTDVGGAVIAHATNGQVTATLRQIVAGSPMSFTSFNGNVDVTLPASAKANLKMRSDRGDVYTDFDVQTVPAPRGQAKDATPTPQTPATPQARRGGDRSRDRDANANPNPNPRYRIDFDRSIYGTVNGGGPDFELRTFNGNIYLRKTK